jgi:NADH-quinone oxidoreductase subunit M
MEAIENNFLTTGVLFTPLIVAIVLMFVREDRVKWGALIGSVIAFGASLTLVAAFDPNVAAQQLQHFQPWITFGNFQINYHVGVDGLSIWMVVLSTFIIPLAILFSLQHIRDRVRLYYILLMVLEFAMIGVFVAQDLFLFYIFFEITLVPMYFIIGIWGSEDRIYAAVKFFIYTISGSILMLLAILWMGNNFGTFNVQEITAMVNAAADTSVSAYPSSLVQGLLFFGFFIAFAIKVPIWPLHSWLPDAHVQAPTAGSVILAGVLLKLGTYGLIRFNLGFFPEASVAFAPIIGALAVIGIIYGAWVSYAQKDVKKLVAYSSISHLGFVVLGIFSLTAAGISGATIQMINHGVSTGGLFLLVGMLYERRHTKQIDAFGGIWKLLPIFSGLSLIIVFSSMGLPGLNGFVGEFTILLGTFGSSVLGGVFASLGVLGIILAAVYLLYMWNKVFMGEYRAPAAAHGHGGGNSDAETHESVVQGEAHGTTHATTDHGAAALHGNPGEHATGHASDAHASDAHAGHDDHGGHGGSEKLDPGPYYPLQWNETLALVIVVIVAIGMGLFATPFFRYMDATVGEYSAQLRRYMPQPPAEALLEQGAEEGEAHNESGSESVTGETTQGENVEGGAGVEGESTPEAEATVEAGQ